MSAYGPISDDPAVQAHYEAMRRDGTSHRLAEMFALQQPPMSNSDREFLQGHCNGSQFEKTPGLGDHYQQVARAGGVDPKGKVYLSGLARYPGDPEAWVSGRDDVRRVCEKNNFSCEGAVSVKSQKLGAPEEVGIAEDLVQDALATELAHNPDLAEKPREEVREQVREKLKPHWVK